MRYIAPYAFQNNKSLTSFVAGDSLRTIADNAFYNCTAMKTFRVGTNLESIGTNAFYGCSAVTNFYNATEVPAVCATSSLTPVSRGTLYVPADNIDDYKNANEWKRFSKVEQNPYAPIYVTLTYKVDNKVVNTLTIKSGTPIVLMEEPTKEGYTFSGWSEIPATMPAADVTITGSFAINVYNIVAEQCEHGQIILESVTTEHGDTVVASIKADEGYVIDEVHVTDGENEVDYIYDHIVGGPITSANITVEHVTSDLYITVTFAEMTAVQRVLAGQKEQTIVRDLEGRKVENPKAGEIYIVNGKRVIWK